jgi:hypothetical protein
MLNTLKSFFRKKAENGNGQQEIIIELKDYLNEFNKTKEKNNSKVEDALKQALDIRKFEIDLYWKRATYFWTIIGVIFAGYFLLIKSDGLVTNPNLMFLVNCIGFIFSLSWWLVNRGSKFWQNNWERHVDLLEDAVTGPLYKRVIQTGELNWFKIHKEYNYSVSKINQLLSFYVTMVWLGMGIYFFTVNILDLNYLDKVFRHTYIKSSILAGVTILAALVLIFKGQSDVVKQNIKKTIIKQRKI